MLLFQNVRAHSNHNLVQPSAKFCCSRLRRKGSTHHSKGSTTTPIWMRLLELPERKRHWAFPTKTWGSRNSRSCWYAGGYQRLKWICPRTGFCWPPCSCCWEVRQRNSRIFNDCLFGCTSCLESFIQATGCSAEHDWALSVPWHLQGATKKILLCVVPSLLNQENVHDSPHAWMRKHCKYNTFFAKV